MKKLIQKTILIVSLAAFAVALPGCGDKEEEAAPATTGPEEGEPAAPAGDE